MVYVCSLDSSHVQVVKGSIGWSQPVPQPLDVLGVELPLAGHEVPEGVVHRLQTIAYCRQTWTEKFINSN